jgi:hypothetical protein
MALASSHLIKTRNNITYAFFSDAAVLTAVPYVCCACIVYYVQLTFVRRAHPDPIALSVVGFKPGTAWFAIDLLGYTLLGISTIFLALSLGTNHTLLVRSMYFHGLISLPGFFLPFLPLIYAEDSDDGGAIWKLPLLSWCLIFAPICFLMSQYFQSFANDERISVGKRE